MRLHFRIPPFSFNLPWWIALPAFLIWLGVVAVYCLGFLVVWLIIQSAKWASKQRPAPVAVAPGHRMARLTRPPAVLSPLVGERIKTQPDLIWWHDRGQIQWRSGKAIGYWKGETYHAFDTPRDVPNSGKQLGGVGP